MKEGKGGNGGDSTASVHSFETLNLVVAMSSPSVKSPCLPQLFITLALSVISLGPILSLTLSSFLSESRLTAGMLM